MSKSRRPEMDGSTRETGDDRNSARAPSYVWRFANAEFDESRWELRVAAEAIDLEPRPLEVLLHLLRRAGEVVTKEDLLDAVYGHRHLSDGALAKAIGRLRRALGSDGALVIATVHRIGYKFAAEVKRVEVSRSAPGRERRVHSLKVGDPIAQREHWRLLRPLGGGETEVWLAEHEKTQALRVYKFSPDGLRLSSLKREVTLFRVLKRTLGTRHDLVPLLDWNFELAPFFLEFEYGGPNLAEWVEAQGGAGAIPLDQRIALMARVAETVAAAHGANVLHKDLKPANILIDRDVNGWLPRLIDFGSGGLLEPERLAALHITQMGFTQILAADSESQFGTPLYLAPELIEGQLPAIKTDVYALGVILYQLAAGNLRKPMTQGWSDDIEDELLRAEIMLAAHGNPARRLGSAHELAERLLRLPERHAALQAALKRPDDAPAANVPSTPVAIDRSIAVLPFASLSADPDNAYFALGIQDEVLTQLSKIGPLKVVARSSTAQFPSRPDNLRAIAGQLGVAHLLIGSVQKAYNHARVNVRLIRAEDDTQVWGESYERTLDRLFEVQGEVARAIAAELQVELSGAERQQLAERPTASAEAYDWYLRGLALNLRHRISLDANSAEAEAYGNAVRLDPGFALAWARLAMAQALQVFSRMDSSPERVAAARSALATALDLQADSFESLLARGACMYWLDHDLDPAKTCIEQALQHSPSSREPAYLIAEILRVQGRFDESLEYEQQALMLDPLNAGQLFHQSLGFLMLRRIPEAKALLERAYVLAPQESAIVAQRIMLRQQSDDLNGARGLIAEIPQGMPDPDGFLFYARGLQALYERRFDAVIDELKAKLARPGNRGITPGLDRLVLASCQLMAGHMITAGASLVMAGAELRALRRDQPNNPEVAANMALTLAAFGQRKAALAEAHRAIALLPASRDAAYGPAFEENLCAVQTMVGDFDDAITGLERLLRIPYLVAIVNPPITLWRLRVEPKWDALRKHPRFQKLLGPPPETTGKTTDLHAPITKTLSAATVIDRSIAVLPFANLSADPDNAYFALGIQDEVLTQLSKIGSLKVIARSSTRHFDSRPDNLREIAGRLGVAHLLAGSVQKAGDRVRINVRLIRAESEAQLWGETFDRTLERLFDVQSEVARVIAGQLQIELSGAEREQLGQRPSANVEAYDWYLRGLAQNGRRLLSFDAQRAEIEAYEHAVRLDPAFALAWARLAMAQAGFFFNRQDVSPERAAAAKYALNRALQLQPDCFESLLARGGCLYWIDRDYEQALTLFKQAAQRAPSLTEPAYLIAAILRRQGRFEESLQYKHRVLALDPLNVGNLFDQALSYAMVRRIPEAIMMLDRAQSLAPREPGILANRIFLHLNSGDLDTARKRLAEIPDDVHDPDGFIYYARAQLALYERRYGDAIEPMLAKLGRPNSKLNPSRHDRIFVAFYQQLAGDSAAAHASYVTAHDEFEALCQQQPENPDVAAGLAYTHAGLGRRELALAEARRAVRLLPSGKDAVAGPTYEEVLAAVQAQVGDIDDAIAALQRLLGKSYLFGTVHPPINVSRLRLDPIWDPLRRDARFQKLIAPAGPLAQESVAPVRPLLTRRKPMFAALALLIFVLASGFYLAAKIRQRDPAAAASAGASIAVLPFANLSSEPESGWFAEGVQDEILTQLGKIGSLKVISRISTQSYASSPTDLRTVARQLGVANILVGSVQRSSGRIRIAAKLIAADSGSQLWAETYDKGTSDILGVENEVARAIANTLRAVLKVEDSSEPALAGRPTNNTEAYEAYLRGLANQARGFNDDKAIFAAARFYAQATKLDPGFLEAWARLAKVDAWLIFRLSDTSQARQDAARHALDQAMKLNADSIDTRLAIANYKYLVERDFRTAEQLFKQLRSRLPNSSDIPNALAYFARRRGLWDQSLAYSEQAIALDPRNPLTFDTRAWTYGISRRYAEAIKTLDERLEILPNAQDAIATQAGYYQVQGRLDQSRNLLARLPATAGGSAVTPIVIEQALLAHDFPKLASLLTTALEKPQTASDGGITRRWYLGFAQILAGDAPAGKVNLARARLELEGLRVREPKNDLYASVLALTYAFLGEKDLALKEGARAMALLPASFDAVYGPKQEEMMAAVEAQVGESSRAIERLKHLLSIGYSGVTNDCPITIALLRLDPIWDPLRTNPEFQKLIAESKPEA